MLLSEHPASGLEGMATPTALGGEATNSVGSPRAWTFTVRRSRARGIFRIIGLRVVKPAKSG